MPLLSEFVVQDTPASEQKKRPNRKFKIRRVAVLGAGTMGARIAAHIASAGLPVAFVGHRAGERRPQLTDGARTQ